MTQTSDDGGPSNFVADIVAGDVAAGKHGGRVQTRFPPEPNGYLHIGHAKSITLNFGLAREFGGKCNLRFDDTNPTTEDTSYVESIIEDVRWLGSDWEDRLFYASDYFDKLYQFALQLIRDGKAYVDTATVQEMRQRRGNFHQPGVDSPHRDRTVEENLALFEKMRAGELDEGSHVLRAKIDMASPNMNLRDPPMYRILKATHHRTGDKWCIYPMYDYAHGLSDAIEEVTHSVCTLEFQDHRPLYDWFLAQLDVFASRQIEFARLNLSFTVLSKRLLLQMVERKLVSGWDDPRMPTLVGMRRRGYTPEAIRAFCHRIGVARRDGVVDVTLLEHALREHLNDTSPRVMGVLRPLRLVIENYPEDRVDELNAPYHPDDPEQGSRTVTLSRVLYVEQDDFREEAPRKWRRLAPGREVRLRYGCLVTCTDVVKNDAGEVIELRCTWDPGSLGGNAPDGRKVKGTLHWVSAAHAVDAEVRVYDRLFRTPNPLKVPADAKEGADFTVNLNPESLEVLRGCKLEPSLADAQPGERYQFERLGYYCVDSVDSRPGQLVFNQTISLRDSWARIEKSQQQR